MVKEKLELLFKDNILGDVKLKCARIDSIDKLQVLHMYNRTAYIWAYQIARNLHDLIAKPLDSNEVVGEFFKLRFH